MKRLDKNNIEDILALTPMQEAMLVQYLVAPERDYFEQLRFTLKGIIRLEHFEKAWNLVIRGNEMLRTLFRWEEYPDPLQIVLVDHPLQWEFHDLSSWDSFSRASRVELILKQDREKIFDLHDVPFRVILCKVDSQEYNMIISNHHIIYDGWSNGIILKEFFNAYTAISLGKTPSLPVKMPFKEFIRWRRLQAADRQKNFWQEYLSGFNGKTKLPMNPGILPAGKTTEVHKAALNSGLWEKLQVAASDYKVSLACLFFSAWGLVLRWNCCCDDVVFGTAVSGRNVPLKGIEDMVGMFINTLPLRVQYHPDEAARDFLERISQQLHRREEFQHTWIGDIKTYIHYKPHEDLFDSMVIIENYPLERASPRDNNRLTVTGFNAFEVKTTYPLTVVIKLFDPVDIDMKFLGGAFEPDVVEGLLHDFIVVLENLSVSTGSAGLEIIPGPKETTSREEIEEEISVDFFL